MLRVIQILDLKVKLFAVYAARGGAVKFVPVLCLGTVEGPTGIESRRITGFVTAKFITPVEDTPGFLGFTEQPRVSAWKKAAATYAAEVERAIENRAKRLATQAVDRHLAR